MKFKKVLALLTISAMLVGSLTGCVGGGKKAENETATTESNATVTKAADATSDESAASDTTSETDNSGEEITLTFLSWHTESYMQGVLDDYKELYPNVTIDLQYSAPVADYIEKFRMLAIGDQLPDIFVTAAENKEDVIENGYAMDLSDLPIWDNMSKANIDCYSDDQGGIYAYAIDAWIAGIFYNKDIFEACSVEVPTNYTEYIQAMKTIKENGYKPWIFNSGNLYDPLQGYVGTETIQKYQAEGKNYDKLVDAGELTYADGWTSPVELWYRDYIETGYMTEEMLGFDPDYAVELWATANEYAMMIGAPWNVAGLAELNPDLNYGMMPFWGTDDKSASMNGAVGVGWSINADTKYPEECKAFIKLLAEKETLTSLQAEGNLLLSVEGIDYEVSPAIAEGLPYLLSGSYYLPAVNWKYSDALGVVMTQSCQEVLTGAIEYTDIVKRMDEKWAEMDAANK